ncbi:MAG: LPS export ABC transporter periplasmic protein LptC [Deltaproteobacteria bacterium]|nr:MAG: LPS export ABC transporter periplasmic protein LptC [Deltaproteobacteria bacterium]
MRLTAPLVLLLLAAWGWGAPSAAEEVAELEMRGLAFVASRANTNEFILESDRVVYLPKTQMAELERVRVRFADQDGELSFQMVCDRGELNLETTDFYAEGNVRARTADGIEISTPHARYERATRRVSGTSPVRISRPNGTITGDGFEYDMDAHRLRVLGTSRMVHGQ